MRRRLRLKEVPPPAPPRLNPRAPPPPAPPREAPPSYARAARSATFALYSPRNRTIAKSNRKTDTKRTFCGAALIDRRPPAYLSESLPSVKIFEAIFFHPVTIRAFALL